MKEVVVLVFVKAKSCRIIDAGFPTICLQNLKSL